MRNVRMLTLSLSMLCAGCASNEPVHVAPDTVTAIVPTPVACIDAKDVPAVPAPTPVDLDRGSVDQHVAALAADALAARTAAIQSRALLIKCSQTPEVKP